MLHMLGQRQLPRSVFPVGGMPKPETRALAERFGLPVASKPDSQELCFAPSGDAGGFVRRAAPQLVHAGEVVDPEGRVLAPHDGTFAFTVGQRRGLGVALGEPAYVLETDAASEPRGRRAGGAALEAGARRGPGLVGGRRARRMTDPFEAAVRVRSRGDDVAAVVSRCAAPTRSSRVPVAAARRRAGAERGDLPRRRGARRRPHRGDTLTAGPSAASALRLPA